MKCLWYRYVLMTLVGFPFILVSMNDNTLNKEIADNVAQKREYVAGLGRRSLDEERKREIAEIRGRVETIEMSLVPLATLPATVKKLSEEMNTLRGDMVGVQASLQTILSRLPQPTSSTSSQSASGGQPSVRQTYSSPVAQIRISQETESREIPIVVISPQEAERLYNIGMNAFQQKDYEQALNFFLNLLTTRGVPAERSALAEAHVGELYYTGHGEGNGFEKARTHFVIAAASSNKRAAIWANARLGHIYYVQNNYNAAIECFDQVIASDVTSWEYSWSLTWSAILELRGLGLTKNPVRAREKLQKVLTLDIKEPLALALAEVHLAEIYYKYEQDQPDINKALTLLVKNSQSKYKQARSHARHLLWEMNYDDSCGSNASKVQRILKGEREGWIEWFLSLVRRSSVVTVN